jgi:hypothetical protein
MPCHPGRFILLTHDGLFTSSFRQVWLVADGDTPPCSMDEATAMLLFSAIFVKIERPGYGIDGGSLDRCILSALL